MEYALTLPCYVIMNAHCNGAVVNETDIGIALAVFSDDDFQRAYRKQHNFIGPTIRFDFEGQLALYLDFAASEGISHVIFDPIGSAGALFPIKDVVQQLVKQAGG